MLTEAHLDVLLAVNDHCETWGRLRLDPSQPLPDLLRDLARPDTEVLTAVADLYELRLITGTRAAEFDYPVEVYGLTAHGRQELPSG